MTGKELIELIKIHNLDNAEISEDTILRFYSEEDDSIAYSTLHVIDEYFDTSVIAIRKGELTYCMRN